jgi:hypothetical protein
MQIVKTNTNIRSPRTGFALPLGAVLLCALLVFPGITLQGNWGYVTCGIFALSPAEEAQAKASYRDTPGFYLNRNGDGSCRFGVQLNFSRLRYRFDASIDSGA